MKRIVSMCLLAAMLLMLLPATSAHAATPADLGWSAYQDDFTGWTVDGNTISCVYDQCASSWLRQNTITDAKNFVIELDLSGDKYSDPYIRVLNVTIGVGGNNGNGNQVFLKVGNGTGTWISAKNTKVHLKIGRYNGGDLQVEVTGAGSYIMTFSAPVRSKDTTIEVGTYRGIMVMENFSVRAPEEGEGPFVYPELDTEKINSKVVPLDVDEYFTFQGAAWECGQDESWGRWLLSSGDDGADAQTVYIREKLSGNWLVNCAVTPVSENNEGVSVSHILFMSAKKAVQLRLAAEYHVEQKQWQMTLQKPSGDGWENLWQQSWQKMEDGTLNLRLDKLSETQVSVQILGDKGFAASATVDVPAETMNAITYAGVGAENSGVRFTGFRIGATEIQMDYAAVAKETYDNLIKNFLDQENVRLIPVRHGFPSQTLTNTGKLSESVNGAGEVWENTVLLMALDTYAQTLEVGSEEYIEVATIISNTVSGFIDFYGNNMRTAGVSPNYLMDDTGWTTMALLLGYHYHKQLGNAADSQECFQYAKDLFNSAYDVFYDDTVGVGLIYSTAHLGVNGYGATLALSGWYMHVIDPADEALYGRVMDVYNGIETYLRRPDGMYWCDMGPNVAYTERSAYGIQEAGSCTYLGANMAMAVLNTLMGNEEKALQTFLGIARYESYANGAYMNDRDAWNNTFFLGMFVREVMGGGIADGHTDRILYATANLILENCVFEDGYYSACWGGPREPESKGWPSIGEYKVDYSIDDRNRWGMGYNNNGLHIGSTPNQVMTSATTAHVILAAALNQKYNNTAAELTDILVDGYSIWPVFDPAITNYSIGTDISEPVVLTLPAADGAVVSVNGETISDDCCTVRGGLVEITVKSGDGKSTRTYKLNLGKELPSEGPEQTQPTQPVQPTEPVTAKPNMDLAPFIVMAVAVLAGAVAVVVILKKKK